MKRIFAALALGLVLVGCQTQPGKVNDIHTGLSAKHSGRYSVHNGLFDSMNVTAIVGTRGGETRYALGTSYLSTGLGWAFFQSAWSYGKQLNFKVTNEKLLGCASGCSMIEEGTVQLSKSAFEAAAKNGLEFKLVGKNREMVVKVPAKVFREALDVK